MSLTTSLDVARSSLAVTSGLSEVASRNIANVNNPSATRKLAMLVTDGAGGIRLSSLSRAALGYLQATVVAAKSDAARDAAISDGIDRLDLTGGQSTDTPASRIAALSAALQTYSANSADQTLAATVIGKAEDVVNSLHDWGANVSALREHTDDDIKTSVANINTALARIHDVDVSIVKGTSCGADTTDDLDARDKLVEDLSQEIGITVVNRSNAGISIYTDSGIAMYDGRVRDVSAHSFPLQSGSAGGLITIDGVVAFGLGAAMPVNSGKLAGLIELRDTIAPTLSAQLDDIAGGLIRAFGETDQTAPSVSAAAGLFTTAAGAATIAPAGTVQFGLAHDIAINSTVDPRQGGNALLLRDGGISNPGNPAYNYNNNASSGFNGRVRELIDALSAVEVHPASTELQDPASVVTFSSSSVGWLQSQRKSATDTAAYSSAILERSQLAFSAEAGISLDDEVTKLLGLERTYQASVKLLSAVDGMFGDLMQAIK